MIRMIRAQLLRLVRRRTVLTRNPHRLQVILGMLIGTLLLAAVAVAVAEAGTLVASLLVAPTKDIPTADWFSAGSLVAGLRDYATVLGGVTGWAVFGATLAAVFRIVPLALGVGFAWAGPIENITVQSWATGYRVFPGQVLASLIQGGTAELAIGRAVLSTFLYTAAAAAITLVVLSRRDVTT